MSFEELEHDDDFELDIRVITQQKQPEYEIAQLPDLAYSICNCRGTSLLDPEDMPQDLVAA